MPALPPPRRLHLALHGLVQGVGFRPFVYRIAAEQGLVGEVRNTSGGVEIEVEGPPAAVEAMLHALQHRLPPLARIDHLDLCEQLPTGATGFTIVESRAAAEGAALISPDVATCGNCLRELFDPSDRRFRYPFTNCTDCGPRFSIVESVPYDRPLTTMRGFPLCPACAREYRDPRDRRFHAEPNACPVCGPRLSLRDGQGRPVACADPLAEAQERLRRGQIVAVKGLGGYHLCCLAGDEGAVARLRERKKRPHKPLAVMARDLAVARRACRIDGGEAAELASPRRPILLLRLRDDPEVALAPGLCPGHRTLGLMLPYTPLHHLLLEPDDLALLMATSGNRSGGPMVADDTEALAVLSGIAEAFLVHDRPIANRCDDSVGFVDHGHTVLLRRSRGYTPLPVPLPHATPSILALGAMLNDTFTLTEGDRAFLSQHVGDTDDADVLDFLEEAVAGLTRWLGVTPAVIAHDLHPDLFTTHLARKMAAEVTARLVPVQHHHAHLAAVLAGAGHPGPATGLILDGTGYGPDGTIWGGEILVGDAGAVRRAGHLMLLPLPGGEAAVRRPWRIAVGWLHALVPEATAWPLPLWERGQPGEAALVRRMVERSFHSPLTSSAGRLFDAVAALLGVATDVSYEGQAAMELEQVALGAARGAPLELQVRVEGARLVLDPTALLRGLAEGLLSGAPIPDLALGFHTALARALVLCAVRIRDTGGPGVVALGGGVFHNRILTRACVEGLRTMDLEPLAPGLVPVGDGGLSLGQALVAGAVLCGASGRVMEE